MSQLPHAKRVMIVNVLVEGFSMRTISRLADVSINMVEKLPSDAGEACEEFHDANVRGVHSKRVQCNEVWSFI